MLKIRLQGTTKDLKWFLKMLARDKRFVAKKPSEPMDIKGSNKYKRVYTEIPHGMYSCCCKCKKGGRKSFRHDELNPNYIIPESPGIPVPYLDKVNQDLADRPE